MANMVDWGGQHAPFWKTHIKDNYTKARVPNSLLEERAIISCRLVRGFFSFVVRLRESQVRTMLGSERAQRN